MLRPIRLGGEQRLSSIRETGLGNGRPADIFTQVNLHRARGQGNSTPTRSTEVVLEERYPELRQLEWEKVLEVLRTWVAAIWWKRSSATSHFCKAMQNPEVAIVHSGVSFQLSPDTVDPGCAARLYSPFFGR